MDYHYRPVRIPRRTMLQVAVLFLSPPVVAIGVILFLECANGW